MSAQSAVIPNSLNNDERLEWLRSGKPLRFVTEQKEEAKPESDDSKAARTIKASWLTDLLQEPAGSVSVPVNIDNAIIEGTLSAPYASYESELSITNSEFLDEVSFSYATFKRTADFSGSRFHKQTTFRAARAKADFILSGVEFSEEASFVDMHVDEVFLADSARFGAADFSRIEVAKLFSFGPKAPENGSDSTHFTGTANFYGARIQGVVDFRGVQFDGDANFTNLRTPGNLFFSAMRFDEQLYHTRFGGEARFFGSHIGLNAEFDGVRFEGKTIFESTQIGGNAYFRNAISEDTAIPTFFGDEANFMDARITGRAEFTGAHFEKLANFTALEVGGPLLFSTVQSKNQISQTYFGGEARFFGVKIQSSAEFNGARFIGDLNFELASIEGTARFSTAQLEGAAVPISFEGNVSFLEARIEGNAIFDGAQFAKNVIFERIAIGGAFLLSAHRVMDQIYQPRLRGKAIFLGAKIQGAAEFNGARFDDIANFESIWIGGNVLFRIITLADSTVRPFFANDVTFMDAHIAGSADFTGSRFNGNANFTLMQVGGVALFQSDLVEGRIYRIRFRKEVRFINIKIQNDALFSAAHFKGPVNINLARIGGNISFVPVYSDNLAFPTVFISDLVFRDAQITGSASFDGAQFGQNADFQRSKIGGNLSFDLFHHIGYKNTTHGEIVNKFLRPMFKGETSFMESEIGGIALFSGAQFHKRVSFERSRIAGVAFFRGNGFPYQDRVEEEVKFRVFETSFGGEALFSGTSFQQGADFSGAKFHEKARFEMAQFVWPVWFDSYQIGQTKLSTEFFGEASFAGAQFKTEGSFQGAVFEKTANFCRCVIEGTASFQNVIFKGLADFSQAKFSTVYFRNEQPSSPATPVPTPQPAPQADEEVSFGTEVDLRGFAYKQIYLNWEEVFKKRLKTYDRQPYSQLEQFYRSSGDERAAGDVYFAQCEHERRHLWNGNQKRLASIRWGAKWLFSYGVRPYRLIGISAAVILLGMIMFSRPQAVMQKRDNLPPAPVTLSCSQAFGYSVRLFIPILEIDSGSRWIPNEEKLPLNCLHIPLSYAGYASFHHLAGAILVPLGIAALTGLLYRRGKT